MACHHLEKSVIIGLPTADLGRRNEVQQDFTRDLRIRKILLSTRYSNKLAGLISLQKFVLNQFVRTKYNMDNKTQYFEERKRST